jgi:dipeptidyl aminopeptidase/acylaminoacyl peptidase
MKLSNLAPLAAMLVLSWAVLRAEPIPAAVFTDPAPDATNPAAMSYAEIPSHGAKINGVLYIAAGAGPHPALLLLHGFPGNEQNLDLAQAARRAGWTVLTLHYRGSWGSKGEFSFSHAIEDAAAAIAYLRTPAIQKLGRLAPNRIAIAGHSMGGFMAAITGAHDPDLIGVGMISAWNISTVASGVKNDTDRAAALDFLDGGAQLLAGCTAQSLFEEVSAHQGEWDFVTYAPALARRPLLLVSSNDGNGPQSDALAAGVRKAGGTAITEVRFPTDHPYSDHRVALQAVLVRWLDSLVAR